MYKPHIIRMLNKVLALTLRVTVYVHDVSYRQNKHMFHVKHSLNLTAASQ